MGLAIRIIPTLLCRNGQLVKGRSFGNDRVVGAALQAARVHATREVDELLIFDVAHGARPDFGFVGRLAEVCFIPVTIGGGVKTANDVRDLLARGADKVSVNSLFLDSPPAVEALAARFGSQAISVCLDVCGHRNEGPAWAVERAKEAEAVGAGELILQSVRRDGTREGYDLDLIRKVSQAVSIPVVASGGCSGYEDMLRAIENGASAVAAGALFQFSDATPKGAAEYLSGCRIEVRL
jgi:cyclase